MDTFLKGTGAVVVVVALVMLLAVLLAYPVMWGWNATMPYLFGFKTISLMQAFWLQFLAGVFFKGSNPSPSTKSK